MENIMSPPCKSLLSSQLTGQQKISQNVNVDELIQKVLNNVNSSDTIKIIDEILKEFSKSDRFVEKRPKFIRGVFDGIRKHPANSKQVDNIANRLILDFPLLRKSDQLKLVEYFLSSIADNNDEFMCWRDALPVLLEILQEEKSISYRSSEIPGSDYKLSIIRTIIDIECSPELLTPLAKMLGELIVDVKNKTIYENIMKSLLSKMEDVKINELPPLVHQLLKLSYDQNTTLLFFSLAKYFKNQYENTVETTQSEEGSENSIVSSNTVTLKMVQEVESTVLYHIYQYAQDSHKGFLEYMKCLKSIVGAPEFILDPFVMSVLLMVSGIFEDQSLQIIKLGLLRHIQEEELENNSAWLRKVSAEKNYFMENINFIISNSNKDRQLVLKGLVDLSFVLLSIESKSFEKPLPWEYGKKILQKVARKRQEAGATILEILIDKIVRSGECVTQYTDCLSFMCMKLTMVVLEHQGWITALLDQLLDIHGNAAIQVLAAVLPLMRVSKSIQDHLVMVLRKAVYRKGTNYRQMAVLGFLQLLKNLKLSSLTTLSQSNSLSCSNVASSTSILTQATLEKSQRMPSINPWTNTSLCREILAILSKCFSHEAELRSHFYTELYYSVSKNVELAEYIIDMLLDHFRKYYIQDENSILPINLDKCCSVQGIDIVIEEPIGYLIFILQKTYVKVATKDSLIIDRLAEILESLCKRMMQLTLENLNINDETDITDPAPKSQQKLQNIKLVVSIYEALIAFKIASWSVDSIDNGRTIVSLFKGYLSLIEFLKTSSKPKHSKNKKDKDKDKDQNNDTTVRKANRAASVKLLNTVFDFDVASKSIVLLYNKNNNWTTADQVSVVNGRIELHNFILQTCMQLFQNMKHLKPYEYSAFTEKNRTNIYLIAETLYKYVLSNLKTSCEFNEDVTILCLECLRESCQLAVTTYSSDLPKFLKLISETDPGIGINLQIQAVLLNLQKTTLSALRQSEEEIPISPKAVVILLQIALKFIKKIVFEDFRINDEFHWIIEIAETDCVEPEIASVIMQILFLLDEKCLEYGTILEQFCKEFISEVGTIDKSENTSAKQYKIINKDTVVDAYLTVNKTLANKIQNINWYLTRLNAELIVMNALSFKDDSNDNNNAAIFKGKEQNLCRQFTHIIMTFVYLANVNIRPGPSSDAIFKNLQKVYTFAIALTKYFRKKSAPNNPAFESVKFIPVIQGAGNKLKEAIQQLIIHIEQNQSTGKSNDNSVQRNKIMKEVMVIPGVVKATNIFEKELLLLAKKTNVDLLKYTKSDAIRDFRINNKELAENIEKMNVSLSLNQTTQVGNASTIQSSRSRRSDSSSEDSNDSNPTPSKRQRTQI